MPLRRWRSIFLMSATVLMAGCPHPQVPPVTVPSAPQPSAAPPTTADTAASPAASLSAAEVVRHPPGLELGGLQLDAPYAAVRQVLDARNKLRVNGIWLDKEGGSGVLLLTPVNGLPLPAEDYYFVDGRLAGDFQRLVQPQAGFAQMTDELAQRFGPGQARPPAWAANLAFIKQLPPLRHGDRRLFWEDKDQPGLLFLQRQDTDSHTLYALFRPAACTKFGLEYAELMDVFQPPPAHK